MIHDTKQFDTSLSRKPASAKRLKRRRSAAAVTLLGLSLSGSIHATESGVGCPLTGMQIAPYAGVVPPTDDWIFSITSIYYEGSLGKTKTIPIAGTISSGLDYHLSYNLVNAIKT
jgi:hypothetical protein